MGTVFTRRPGWRYDFRNSLKDIHSAKPKPAVVLKSEDVASCGKNVKPVDKCTS